MCATRRTLDDGTMTTLAASRVLTALASGLITTAYYATPDFVASRVARRWAKAGIAAVSVAVDLPQLLAERASRRSAAEADLAASADRSVGAGAAPGADVVPRADDAEPSPSDAAGSRLVALGVLAGVVASVAGLVAVERGIYRRCEARAAAGVRFAHTRAAAALGALTVVLSLIPSLSGDDDADGGDARTA